MWLAVVHDILVTSRNYSPLLTLCSPKSKSNKVMADTIITFHGHMFLVYSEPVSVVKVTQDGSIIHASFKRRAGVNLMQ